MNNGGRNPLRLVAKYRNNRLDLVNHSLAFSARQIKTYLSTANAIVIVTFPVSAFLTKTYIGSGREKALRLIILLSLQKYKYPGRGFVENIM